VAIATGQTALPFPPRLEQQQWMHETRGKQLKSAPHEAEVELKWNAVEARCLVDVRLNSGVSRSSAPAYVPFRENSGSRSVLLAPAPMSQSMHEMATMHDAATAAAESPFLKVEEQWAQGPRVSGLQDLRSQTPAMAVQCRGWLDRQGRMPRLLFPRTRSLRILLVIPRSGGQTDDLLTFSTPLFTFALVIRTTTTTNNASTITVAISAFRIVCFPASQLGLSKIRVAGDPRLPTRGERSTFEILVIVSGI
jgi:hypothetical protein